MSTSRQRAGLIGNEIFMAEQEARRKAAEEKELDGLYRIGAKFCEDNETENEKDKENSGENTTGERRKPRQAIVLCCANPSCSERCTATDTETKSKWTVCGMRIKVRAKCKMIFCPKEACLAMLATHREHCR